MMLRAPAIGWGALLTAGAAVALGSLPVQLAFAVVAIGVIGMAHGASDLAIVARGRRPLFLSAYLATSAACLLWWTAIPAVALPAFLAASAVHFGLEDAPDGPTVERVARGVGLVAAPAVLHMGSLTILLGYAGMPAEWLPGCVRGLVVLGGAGAATLLAFGLRRRDMRLLSGALMLLILPPLIGFSLGFLLLHALPQTHARRERLGCDTTMDYVVATLPVLILALVMTGVVGAVLLRWDHTGTRALFAGVAALAVPHLLVTPWFDRAAHAGGNGAIMRNVAIKVRSSTGLSRTSTSGARG
jgi:beta-carotene 15,15'-dioxygenase